jgi:O-antigen/teichoic acid export membrane protein
MLDFILKKFVPFGLARTLSLAGIPLMQFAVMLLCSKEEAGKFYLVSNAAFVASQIADLGISRAFPVFFAAEKETPANLAEIISLRLITAILLGSGFIFINGFGEISWSWQTTGLTAMLFVTGRIILLGNQGYRHAHQEFNLLLRGAFFHIFSSISFIIIALIFGRFGAETALVALTLGIWTELLLIDAPQARPIRFIGGNFRAAIKTVTPFATVGLSSALYGRIETFVAGKLLAPAALGIFGTLDSAFKICIWPSYVSAQTVFPAICEQVKQKNSKGLGEVARRHFKLGAMICILAMLTTFIIWYLRFSGNPEITMGALILWLSIWMTIPNAFMIPLFYSMGLEAVLARSMFFLALIRGFLAVVLAINFGFVGLCASHSVITLSAVLVLWTKIRLRLQNLSQADAAESK